MTPTFSMGGALMTPTFSMGGALMTPMLEPTMSSNSIQKANQLSNSSILCLLVYRELQRTLLPKS